MQFFFFFTSLHVKLSCPSDRRFEVTLMVSVGKKYEKMHCNI